MKKTLLVTKPDYFNPLHIARMHHLQYAQCTPHSMDHKTMWQINFQIFLLRFPTKCWIFDQTVAWAAGTRHTGRLVIEIDRHHCIQHYSRGRDWMLVCRTHYQLVCCHTAASAQLYPYPQHWRLWSVHCPVFPLFFTDCEPGDFLSVEVDTLTL